MITIFESDTSYWKISIASELPTQAFADLVGYKTVTSGLPLLVSGYDLYITLSAVSGYVPGHYTLIPYIVTENENVKFLKGVDLFILERR